MRPRNYILGKFESVTEADYVRNFTSPEGTVLRNWVLGLRNSAGMPGYGAIFRTLSDTPLSTSFSLVQGVTLLTFRINTLDYEFRAFGDTHIEREFVSRRSTASKQSVSTIIYIMDGKFYRFSNITY